MPDEPQSSVVTEKQASSLFSAIEQGMTTKTGGKYYSGKANVKSYKTEAEIAILLRDIGDVLSVNYGAYGSGADSHDVLPSLVGIFRYELGLG